ncbi:hypothetical protein ABVT39_012431 [Epinephelus coioides]
MVEESRDALTALICTSHSICMDVQKRPNMQEPKPESVPLGCVTAPISPQQLLTQAADRRPFCCTTDVKRPISTRLSECASVYVGTPESSLFDAIRECSRW